MEKRDQDREKWKKKKSGSYANRFKGRNEPQIVQEAPPRVNVQPDPHCPYKAWKFYFPTEEYVPGSRTVQTVQILEAYMAEYLAACDEDAILKNQSISIDYKDIASHRIVRNNLADFEERLLSSPDLILSCIGLATHQVAMETLRKMAFEDEDQPDVPVIIARIHNLDSLMTLKELKARSYGQFVAVKGTVVKVGNVKPVCTTLAFKCDECGRMQVLFFLGHISVTPNSCDDSACYGRRFTALRGHPLTQTVDWQSVKLQEELSDLHRESGRVPRAIEIELTRDLIDNASPGDVVTVTGIMRDRKTETNSKDDNCMSTMYLEGNHVSNTRRRNMQDCRGADANTSLEFTKTDMDGIALMQSQEDVFSLLVASVCPTIYGLEMVKAGIVLALFGGDQVSSKPSDNRVPFRGDSHVLIVGDPGMGKSQMLIAASRLAPRGVYVCGNTSTSSGLSVTLSRDSNGDTALEAGALVLADQGVCCIDEFDKMGAQQQVLLEAMEQQSISIAKAGVVCSLPARCSIIAAGNPAGGHYTKNKTVSENLRMGGALLSRFDLVFVLVDQPDEEKDKMLSDHVMAFHSSTSHADGMKTHSRVYASSRPSTSSLESRLAEYCRREDVDPVPHSLAWKYIAHARKTISNIALSEEACQVLKEFYLKMRRERVEDDGTPITTRQLESLKRLAQARAKLEMRHTVTGQDARDVVEIMKYSLRDTFSDANDSLVFSRSLHGSGVSDRAAAKKLISVLHKLASRKGQSTMTVPDMNNAAVAAGLRLEKQRFLQIVDSLNNQGYLLKRGGGIYKLQTN